MNEKVSGNKTIIIDVIDVVVVSMVFAFSASWIIPYSDLRIAVSVLLTIISLPFIANYVENYKEVYKNRKHPYIVTTISILLFPLMLCYSFNNNAGEYLKSYPENNMATFIFDAIMEKNGDYGIGNEIHRNTFVNDIRISGKTYQNGSIKRLNDTISVRVDKPIIVRTRISEIDDSVSDYGEEVYKLDYFVENKNELHIPISFSQNITVREKGGRVNSGAFADFTVNYTVKRIIPDWKTWLLLLFKVTENKDIFYLLSMFLIGIWSAHSVFSVNKKVRQIENEKIDKGREKEVDVGDLKAQQTKAESENERMICDVDSIAHQLENWCIFLDKQEKPMIVEVIKIHKGYFLNEVMNCFRQIAQNEKNWIISESACSDKVRVYTEAYERFANIVVKYSNALYRVAKLRVNESQEIEELEHGFIVMVCQIAICLCNRTVIYKRINWERQKGYVYSIQLYKDDISKLIEANQELKRMIEKNMLSYDITLEEEYYRAMLYAQRLKEFRSQS